MSDFISAHVSESDADWQSQCDALLARTGIDLPGQLAFLYFADTLAGDTDRIIDYLRERTGVGHWVGCAGMGLCGTGSESYQQPGLSMLATPFGTDDFRVFPSFDAEPSDWLEATQAWRDNNLASIAIVHGDPASVQLPDLLQTFSNALGGGFLIGGIASAEQMAVQVADRATGGGLSGVLLSGTARVQTGLSQGCSLIGNKHVITANERNVIATIDERPALDVLKEDIGEILARDLSRIGGYIFAALPISGSDTGDYLVRNLIGIDPDQGLLAIGDLVEPGMEIQFARRDADTARDDLERMIKALQKRLDGQPRGALYHSCLGRGRNLFGDDAAELKIIQDLLGDVPLAGFYANGEISHNRLYGYTGVLTLFC